MSYRLYVDEVGNDDLGHVGQEANRFLSLTGVAIRLDHSRDFLVPKVAALKAEVFQHDPDEPLVFHRTDIVSKKKAFGALVDADTRARFDDGIIEIFRKTSCAVITVVIDKRAMMTQSHWNQKHPYHYLMEILVEKYVQFLKRQNTTGDIMPEMRRGRQDKELQKAFLDVRAAGTYYVHRSLISERLPAKNLKFRAKSDNVAGLQICDLFAHPSYIYVRKKKGHAVTIGPFAGRVIDVLVKEKYDRSWNGRIDGYGIKYLP